MEFTDSKNLETNVEFIDFKNLELDMEFASGFKITETKEGFIYKNKKYKWGTGLIEFVNTDFSEFINLIKTIEASLYASNSKEPIDRAFNPILGYNTNSLHINLLQDYLRAFYDRYDPCDEIGNLLTYDTIQLIGYLQNDFKGPIVITQANYKEIIKYYSSNNNKELPDEIIRKLNRIVSKENNFPDLIKNYTGITKSGQIQYETIFYKIETFCKYEFFKVLENNIKIFQCKYCGKFFISEHGKTSYCNEKCRKKYNSDILKNNPYFKEYYKYIKKIYNHCDYYKISTKKRNLLLDPLKKVYNNYKQFMNKEINQENLKEYKKELENEFNKLNI